MRFGQVCLEACDGQILGHNVSDETGRRVLRKGQRLDTRAIARLRALGHLTVFVADLEEGDVAEDQAAERISRVVAGAGVEANPPHTGRVNLLAKSAGIARVDIDGLLRLNEIEGITVATLHSGAYVHERARVATVKVIPYAIPEAAVSQSEEELGPSGLVSLDPIGNRTVALILVGGEGARLGLEEGLGSAIIRRLEGWGCEIPEIAAAHPNEEALADVLRRENGRDPAMIVVAGETAIMDLDDVIPRGLRSAGGRVEGLGLPMDPGHLLLLGYLAGTPVVGAPGCVRGSLPDGFDAVVPRLLSGEQLTRLDLHRMGHGGLLADPRRA